MWDVMSSLYLFMNLCYRVVEKLSDKALADESLVGFYKNPSQYFQRMSICGEYHSTPFRMEFLPPTVSQTSAGIPAISQPTNQD